MAVGKTILGGRQLHMKGWKGGQATGQRKDEGGLSMKASERWPTRSGRAFVNK
jgi:hypothetical protein